MVSEIRASVLVTEVRRPRAVRFGRYPSSRAAWRMRFWVASAIRISVRPDRTKEAAVRETPARRATSAIVTRRLGIVTPRLRHMPTARRPHTARGHTLLNALAASVWRGARTPSRRIRPLQGHWLPQCAFGTLKFLLAEVGAFRESQVESTTMSGGTSGGTTGKTAQGS